MSLLKHTENWISIILEIIRINNFFAPLTVGLGAIYDDCSKLTCTLGTEIQLSLRLGTEMSVRRDEKFSKMETGSVPARGEKQKSFLNLPKSNQSGL